MNFKNVLRTLVISVAFLGAVAWLFGVAAGVERAWPWFRAFAIAYPALLFVGYWVGTTLTCMAVVCRSEGEVTWGDAVMSTFLGPVLVGLFTFCVVLFGPLIGAFTLEEKWFPKPDVPPAPTRERPPWMGRRMFACPKR